MSRHRDDKNEDDAHRRNFIDCVKSRRTPEANLETAHIAAVHMHLGNIIARTGEARLRFDAKTDTVAEPAGNRFVKREYRKHWATPRNV